MRLVLSLMACDSSSPTVSRRRRNSETFELSFVRGHTSTGSGGSPTNASNQVRILPTCPLRPAAALTVERVFESQGASASTTPSSVVKGTPSGTHSSVAPARPTPKALFRSPGGDAIASQPCPRTRSPCPPSEQAARRISIRRCTSPCTRPPGAATPSRCRRSRLRRRRHRCLPPPPAAAHPPPPPRRPRRWR